jgi:predicted small lipoprotein YifL
MKKSLLLASLVAAVALAACGKKPEEAPAAAPAAPAAAPMADAAASSAADAASSAMAAASSAVDVITRPKLPLSTSRSTQSSCLPDAMR